MRQANPENEPEAMQTARVRDETMQTARVRDNVRSLSIFQNIIQTTRSLAVSKRGRLRLLTAPARCLPDFLIIGAQRSGSSTLFKYLTDHPQVLPPDRKELHFFDLTYRKGDWFYRSKYPLRITRRLRSGSTGVAIKTGEATPYYLPHPLVAERVAAMLPECRFIAVLRNPVDRAFSQYQGNVVAGFERYPFEKAVDLENSRIDTEVDRMLVEPSFYSWKHRRFSYLERGYYAKHLERWLRLFPRESFLILKSEALFADPNDTLSEVWSFLELEPFQIPEATRERPASYREELNEETRYRLTKHFKPHNEKLYELIGKDFNW